MTSVTDPSDSWSRSAFSAGGGDALVFYVLFAGLDVAPQLVVSPERHRTTGLPDGVHLIVRDRSNPEFTSSEIALFGDDVAFETARASTLQFVLAGTIPDPSDLGYLRDVLGVAAALVDAGARAILDLQTLRLFSAAEFMREVFEPDAPLRDAHLSFMSSDDEANPGTLWLHTRGLRKFGRPDISIRGLDPSASEVGADVLHRFAELGIRGGIIPEGRTISIAGFPEGFACHHGGSFDDFDFNNLHVEIRRSR